MIVARYRILIISILITFGFVHSTPAHAMDARVKSLGVMAAYGTIGGALLGTASLAFGSSGRSVAKGASLGLYAGILFGTYVVASHAYKRRRRNNPEPDPAPYGGDAYEDEPEQRGSFFDGFNWGGFGGGQEEGPGGDEGYQDDGYAQRWNPYFEMGNLRYSADGAGYEKLRPSKTRPTYYLNIFNYQF